jgi:hypothetical protein
MPFDIKSIFERDYARYDGVRRINVYLLRALFFLMATLLAMDVWTYIFGHQGPWAPQDAMVWSVWAGFSTLAILGVFYPLKMIPILLLEIFYKCLWLMLVAYPLWRAGALAGSPAAAETYVFLPVGIVIVIMPWGYVFRKYVIGTRK